MDDPLKTLGELNGKRLTAREIMLTNLITPHAITNVTTKSNLQLCSEPTGQGHKREFCLIDAYQIGLYTILSRITGKAQWAAAALNELMLSNWIDRMLDTTSKVILLPENTQEQRQTLRGDIFEAPQYYTYRNADEPYFVVADYHQIIVEATNITPKLWKDETDPLDPVRLGCVVVNMTGTLARIDALLYQHLEARKA